jgi:hypothetical protein
MKIATQMKTGLLATLMLMATHTSGAFAGVGGSNGQIRSAIASGSVDAIIAEVERTEGLMCAECVDTVTALIDHNSYQVREVAAWWFAKRPSLATMMTAQMLDDLSLSNDSRKLRNAADFLGSARAYESMDALGVAMKKTGVTAEARLAMVRALGAMGKKSANPTLSTAMADSDAAVRKQALIAWRDLRGQTDAAPAVALLGDADAGVRAEAATLAGGFKQASAHVALEGLVLRDADATVRRNAAWALGKIADRSSRDALTAASNDASPLVSGVARAALASLK